jgi:hypothetical protein
MRLPRAVVLSRTKHEAELSSFRCSTGAWYEDEVEQMVQHELAPRIDSEWSRALDFCALGLVDHLGRLVAIGAHHEVDFANRDPPGTRLWLAAIAVSHQGARISGILQTGGQSFSLARYLLQVMIADSLNRPHKRERSFVGTVAKDNYRSLALCERIGLRRELPDPRDDRYVQRLGILDPSGALSH